MMTFVRELFAHYKSYHLHGPLMLRYAGILGAVGFPAFYLLRFTKSTMPYDDLAIRLVATLLCLLLVVKDHWPQSLKPRYIAFSYFVLLGLPVTLIFTALKNGGGVVAVANTLMVIFFVILMTDWRNTIAMLVLGTGAAVLLYVATEPDPRVPMDYVARLPLFLLVVAGGTLFKFASNQAAAEKMRHAYASIAGTIAHEMRHPLGQVKHNLEGMQQALPSPTARAQSQTLAAHHVDALYFHLANSELAVRRGLQVIAMTLEEVSVTPVDTSAFSCLSAAAATSKAVEEYGYESAADRAKVSVRVDEDFTFRGSETAYLFVLFNLLRNALYHLALREDARVAITVGRQEVVVHDSGPGIASEVLAGLFQPFNAQDKSGGTGLGLAYCRRVVHAFGGQIECASVVGEYTRFTLRFPPVTEQERRTQRLGVLGEAQAAFSSKRLLIVDADAGERRATLNKLHLLTSAIEEAADGQRALEMLSAQHYDLVLLDLDLPVLDGYAVAERIRQARASANRDVCIVAYTVEAGHLAGVRTRKAGMDSFVSKPCAQLPLVQALHHALDCAARRVRPDGLLAGRRIVVADDSPAARKAAAVYLEQAGATVTHVGHGQAVLDHLQAGEPCDAIVMDIRMPGMDGIETTRAIRCSGRTWCDVPVVALTAHSDDRTLLAAQAAGMDDFIVKPVDADLLCTKLGRLVGRGGPMAPAQSGHGTQAPAAGMGEASASYGAGPFPVNAS